MTDSHPRSTEALKRDVSADGGLAVRDDAPAVALYLAGRPPRPAVAGPARDGAAARAKLATIAVPFTFKWATDALAGQATAPVAAASWLFWVWRRRS